MSSLIQFPNSVCIQDYLTNEVLKDETIDQKKQIIGRISQVFADKKFLILFIEPAVLRIISTCKLSISDRKTQSLSRKIVYSLITNYADEKQTTTTGSKL